VKLRHFFVILFLTTASLGFAQDTSGKAPIDISADDALEWDRKNAKYIARGNAKLVQGDTTLLANRLEAKYDAKSGDSSELTEIEAFDNVEILNDGVRVTADKGIYDLGTEVAKLTGENLKMISKDYTLTAEQYFEYSALKNFVKAVGDAQILQNGDRLRTNVLIAKLGTDANGATIVKTVDAPGFVRIITENEVITGARGQYDAISQIAVLTGDVKITQGQNVLSGERARVDMKTGVSQLFAAENEKGLPGRVRGVFYPKSSEGN
jgi:lipopolysaccharide export system protein LptA